MLKPKLVEFVAVMAFALLVSFVVAGSARAEFGVSAMYGGCPHFYFKWKLFDGPSAWRSADTRGKLTQAPTDRVRNAPSDGVVPAKAKKQ